MCIGTRQNPGFLECADQGVDECRRTVAMPGQCQIDGARAGDVAEDDPGELERSNGFGNKGNPESGSDQRQQHRRVRSLVLTPRAETRCATTTDHRLVDH